MRNLEYFRGKLLTLKAEVTNRMEKVETDIKHEGITSDLYDQAIELENEEVLNALARTSKQELSQIDKALERLDLGTFFFCSECGEEISQPRLEVLPFTRYCVECAEKQEQKQKDKLAA